MTRSTKAVSQVLKNAGLDFKYASAGPGAIAIEQFGALYLYDLKSGKEHKLDIRLGAICRKFGRTSSTLLPESSTPIFRPRESVQRLKRVAKS